MTQQAPDFILAEGEDARKEPVRLVVVQGEDWPTVQADEEPVVMTFPHLLVRELVALVGLSLLLAVISLSYNAPLEEMANPTKTPNPAKAPWYFLGLQELLHYYPPVVSGVVLPGLVVVALAVIPYFEVNVERRGLWKTNRLRKAAYWAVSVACLTVVFLVSGAHPIWPILGPLWVVAAIMVLPLAMPGSAWVERWVANRSLAFWVFTWFLLVSVVLTVIGVFFRGPGWEFTLPWRDGIY